MEDILKVKKECLEDVTNNYGMYNVTNESTVSTPIITDELVDAIKEITHNANKDVSNEELKSVYNKLLDFISEYVGIEKPNLSIEQLTMDNLLSGNKDENELMEELENVDGLGFGFSETDNTITIISRDSELKEQLQQLGIKHCAFAPIITVRHELEHIHQYSQIKEYVETNFSGDCAVDDAYKLMAIFTIMKDALTTLKAYEISRDEGKIEENELNEMAEYFAFEEFLETYNINSMDVCDPMEIEARFTEVYFIKDLIESEKFSKSELNEIKSYVKGVKDNYPNPKKYSLGSIFYQSFMEVKSKFEEEFSDLEMGKNIISEFNDLMTNGKIDNFSYEIDKKQNECYEICKSTLQTNRKVKNTTKLNEEDLSA